MGKRAAFGRNPPRLSRGLFYGNSVLKIRKRVPDMVRQTGRVNTQANKILVIVPLSRLSLPPDANMAPAIPDDKTCVVLTGRPSNVDALIVLAATISADAP